MRKMRMKSLSAPPPISTRIPCAASIPSTHGTISRFRGRGTLTGRSRGPLFHRVTTRIVLTLLRHGSRHREMRNACDSRGMAEAGVRSRRRFLCLGFLLSISVEYVCSLPTRFTQDLLVKAYLDLPDMTIRCYSNVYTSVKVILMYTCPSQSSD